MANFFAGLGIALIILVANRNIIFENKLPQKSPEAFSQADPAAINSADNDIEEEASKTENSYSYLTTATAGTLTGYQSVSVSMNDTNESKVFQIISYDGKVVTVSSENELKNKINNI